MPTMMSADVTYVVILLKTYVPFMCQENN